METAHVHFLTVLETGKFETEFLTEVVSGEGPLPGLQSVTLLCPHMASPWYVCGDGEQERAFRGLCLRGHESRRTRARPSALCKTERRLATGDKNFKAGRTKVSK